MRRLLAVAATLGIIVTGAALPASGASDDRVGWDRTNAAQRVLRDGAPEEVGLLSRELELIEPALREGLTREPTPFYPGAVALVASKGVVVERTAVGHAVRWADATTELPVEEQVEMRTDTIVDLASLSKLFTAVAVMQLVEAGEVDLADTAASYVPAFAANGKEGHHRRAAPHPHRRPAGVDQPVERTGRDRRAPAGLGRHADEHARDGVPLQRPRAHHAG